MRSRQPSLFDVDAREEASLRRDTGIARSADRNEREQAGWQDAAMAHLRVFLASQTDTFLAEDVRSYATSRGLAAPTDGRAWGAVMQRAKRAGLIVSVGYAPANSSNLSPKVLWRKALD